MDISWPVKKLSHKQLIIIPLIVAAFFGSVIALNWYSTGRPLSLTMEFGGGSFVRVENIQKPSSAQIENIEKNFREEFGGTLETHTFENGMEIETSAVLLGAEENQIMNQRIENLLIESGIKGNPEITTTSMGSIVTALYQQQALYAAIAAIVVMAIALFVALRSFSTVGSILTVVGLDFLGIIGGMAILGIPLGLASMAGILLLFGYAVNTNILLSTNVLKRKGGTARERAGRAMSTGIKMSSTSAGAMIILNLATSAPALEQISAVIAIGILVDMLNTWLLNSGLILRHQTGKEEKYHARI